VSEQNSAAPHQPDGLPDPRADVSPGVDAVAAEPVWLKLSEIDYGEASMFRMLKRATVKRNVR